MTMDEIHSLVRSDPKHPGASIRREWPGIAGKGRFTARWGTRNLGLIPESTPIPALLLQDFLAHICASFDHLSLRMSTLAADLHSLRREMRQVAGDLRERPVVRHTALSDLGTPHYSLTTPLPVVIEEYRDQVLARWPEIQATGTGTSEPEAIWRLKEEVLELMDELSTSSPEELGPEPLQALYILRRFVTPGD